jgi:hypothetical protein
MWKRRSNVLVLPFVSVDVWRSFISCQKFLETGNVGRKSRSGQPMICTENVSYIMSTNESMMKVKCLKNCQSIATKTRPTFGKEREKTTACLTTNLFEHSLLIKCKNPA